MKSSETGEAKGNTVMSGIALSRRASDCGYRMTFDVGEGVVGRGVAVYDRRGRRMIGSGVIGWA